MTLASSSVKSEKLHTTCVMALDRALARAEKHLRNQKFASADKTLGKADRRLHTLRSIAASVYGASKYKRELNRLVQFYSLWHSALSTTVAVIDPLSETERISLGWQHERAVDMAARHPRNHSYKRLVQKIDRWQQCIDQHLSQDG